MFGMTTKLVIYGVVNLRVSFSFIVGQVIKFNIYHWLCG